MNNKNNIQAVVVEKGVYVQQKKEHKQKDKREMRIIYKGGMDSAKVSYAHV